MSEATNPFPEGTSHHDYANALLEHLGTRHWLLHQTPDSHYHIDYPAGMGSSAFYEPGDMQREVIAKLLETGALIRRKKDGYVYGLGSTQADIVPPQPPALSELFKDATMLERAVALMDELTSEDGTNQSHAFIRKKNGEYTLLRFRPGAGGNAEHASPTESVILSRLVATEWLVPESEGFEYHEDLIIISGHEFDDETGEENGRPVIEPDSEYGILYKPADFDYHA